MDQAYKSRRADGDLQSLFVPQRRTRWGDFLPAPIRFAVSVIALAGAIQFCIWGKAVIANGIKATAREDANTEIACDICGRAVTDYWEFNIQPTGHHTTGLMDKISAAVAAIPNAGQTMDPPPPRHYELCPECYQDFKIFFHAEKGSLREGG